MSKKNAADVTSFGAELTAILAAKFSGIRVETAHSTHWNRPCVTFRWHNFAGLLPEERFHRLVSAIPADFREKKLVGFVWLELADGETIDEFLRLPRSEDVADRGAKIYAGLMKAGLF